MFKGTVPVAMTGHRKATAVYCPRCRAWHDTPRGLEPESCPRDLVATVRWYGPLGERPAMPKPVVPCGPLWEALDRALETPGVIPRLGADPGRAPAFIPRDHLGTVRRGRVRVPFRVELAEPR